MAVKTAIAIHDRGDRGAARHPAQPPFDGASDCARGAASGTQREAREQRGPSPAGAWGSAG
jgi:hypothetical protein